MTEIRLHTKETASQLNWAGLTQEEDKRFLLAFLNEGVSSFIANIETTFHILQVGNRAFPLTVNETDYGNAYPCSPYTHYLSYALQELHKIPNQAIAIALSLLIRGASWPLKAAKINKAVCVNNGMFTTNLYPRWEGKEAKQLTEYLCSTFPKHAILFRSLNCATNAVLLDQLHQHGYQLIPSREVFIFDEKLKRHAKKRNMQIDFKLLEKTPYRRIRHEDITPCDYQTIVDLYIGLYFGKYSSCNPRFTEKFIRFCHENRYLNLQGIRDQAEKMIAVVGSFQRNGILATPFVGYDRTLPLKEGLFRMATALAIQEAQEKGWVFNISSGVSQFKRWRGAVKFVEYSAVYTKHLPLAHRSAWNSLNFLMTNIGLPLLNRFKF